MMLTADTANHFVLSLQRPDWEVRFDMDKAQAAAQQAYEGGYQLTGECQQSACLARHYPDFAALTASGEFAGLATSLYQRLGSAFRVIDEHREEHP